MNKKASHEDYLKSLSEERFLLNLEGQICQTLNLTKNHQHQLRTFEDNKTGSLRFAKENSYWPGKNLDLITKTILNFYRDNGFNVICESENNNYPQIKGLLIPKDYYQSNFLTLNKEEECYSVHVSQGDEYPVYITNSILKNFAKSIRI